jgi:hypothetical protein
VIDYLCVPTLEAADFTLRRLAELFNLLINPVVHNFALRWHRDDVRGDATTEEERDALAIWHHGVSGVAMGL